MSSTATATAYSFPTATAPRSVLALAASAPTRPTRATFWRRRLGVLAAILTLALLLIAVVGQGAEADLLAPQVSGSAVVEPGDTLWSIAVAHAPAGQDPRTYLSRLEQLNDLVGVNVPAWTVVLLPAT